MCVISHSVGAVIYRDMKAYIVESVHMPVICVVNHSVERGTSRHMSTYIVASGHMPVVSAINHLHVGVT
jgi:hypothetical protein